MPPDTQPPPSIQPQSQGLAITSMVLGILSLITCAITGLPAIICGHIAHSRARRSPETHGGTGLAITGFTLGYLSIAIGLLILPALLLPALAQAKAKAQSITCVSNLKMITLAARMYANDHNETYPAGFLVMSNELNSPRVLVCPSDPNRQRALDWSGFNRDRNLSYEFLQPGLAEDANATSIEVFRCPIHGHVSLGDGSVHEGSGRNGPG